MGTPFAALALLLSIAYRDFRAHKWDLNPDPRKGSQAAAEEEMDHQGPCEKGPSPVPFIPGWVVVGKLKQKTKR